MALSVDNNRRAVGVFSDRQDVEHALHELRDSGFPMDRVSVITQDADRKDDIAGAEVRERVDNKADEGAKVGALSGAALGGLTGLLVGLGTLAIPGIGPIMLAGATATALATTVAGVGIGAAAGSLLGALIGLGIPEERARVYNERVERGHYLVIVDGADAEIARAEAILHHRGIEEFGIYDHPNGKHTPTPVAHKDLSHIKHAIGYFSNLRDAEAAINDLRAAGFPLSKITLIRRDFSQREPFAGIAATDRFDNLRLGLSAERTHFYNELINRGEYMIVIDGNDDELRHAGSVFSRHGIKDWYIYDPTAINTTSSVSAAPVAASMQRPKLAIGVFSQRESAETALIELRNAGFSMNKVSLIAKNAHDNDRIAGVDSRPGVGNKVDERATGNLVGVLVGLGIPEERAQIYSDRFHRGDYLVMIEDTDTELQRAQTILKQRGIDNFIIYDAAVGNNQGMHHAKPDFDTTPTNYSNVVDNNDPLVIIIDRRDENFK